MNILGIGPLLAIIGGVSFVIVFLLQKELGVAITLSSPWQ
jgi:hypothetical protein